MSAKRVVGFSLIWLLVLAGCSNGGPRAASSLSAPAPSAEQGHGITDGVVKVMASFPVVVDGQGGLHSAATISNPVTIVNPSNVRFSLNGDAVTVPPISNALLDFGKLAIGDLFDNKLNVCGTDGKHKCSQAYIQMYTTGTPGGGLWNDDGYGMPIYANLPNTTRLTVGLNAANAAVVQTQAISASKHVLRLADFSVAPIYEMHADFTEAGAGSYSTTLVVEYGLLP